MESLSNMTPPFGANLLWAMVAGMIAAVLLVLLIRLLKAAGRNLDLPYLLGSYFVDISNRSKVYVAGTIIHIVIGGVWGFVYLVTMLGLSIEPTWVVGILWGFAHGIIAGVLMGTISQTHPYVGEGKPIPDPGILGSRLGTFEPYLVLGLHVIFGIVTIYVYSLLVPTIIY